MQSQNQTQQIAVAVAQVAVAQVAVAQVEVDTND